MARACPRRPSGRSIPTTRRASWCLRRTAARRPSSMPTIRRATSGALRKAARSRSPSAIPTPRGRTCSQASRPAARPEKSSTRARHARMTVLCPVTRFPATPLRITTARSTPSRGRRAASLQRPSWMARPWSTPTTCPASAPAKRSTARRTITPRSPARSCGSSGAASPSSLSMTMATSRSP